MEAAAGYKRTITAADPAAAARGAGSLLAAVAAGDEAKSLEARHNATPVEAALTGGELPSPDSIDGLAAFFAQKATAQALLAAAAAGDEDLAHMLDSPPYNRSARCEEVTKRNLTAQVVSCLCDGVLPWPHCDALLHVTLSEVWATQMPLLSAALAQLRRELAANASVSTGAGAGAGAGRRRHLHQYMSCDGVDSLFMFDPASGGCIQASCEAGIWGVGSIHGSIQLCSTGQVCDSSECYEWALSDLADISLSSHIVDASISGRVGVCLSVFGLNQLLSWFGFDGAFCEDKDGTWSPVRGQISVGGTVSLGWSVAGLWAQLDGRMQYLNAADNPLCNTLGQYNTWWGCQDFCNWQSGDGVPTAMAGWDFLFWGDSESYQVLASREYYC